MSDTPNSSNGRWHIDRTINVSTLFTLGAAIVSVIVWGGTVQSKIDGHEMRIATAERAIAAMSEANLRTAERLARIEALLETGNQRMTEMTKAIESRTRFEVREANKAR